MTLCWCYYCVSTHSSKISTREARAPKWRVKEMKKRNHPRRRDAESMQHVKSYHVIKTHDTMMNLGNFYDSCSSEECGPWQEIDTHGTDQSEEWNIWEYRRIMCGRFGWEVSSPKGHRTENEVTACLCYDGTILRR